MVQPVARFWLELWNARAMEEMLARIDPDYAQRDHRAVTDSGSNLEEWQQLMRSWWEIAPDARVVECTIVAEAGDRVAYFLRVCGHDSLSGGELEVPMYVVNRLLPDGRISSADLFDDADAAIAFFERMQNADGPPEGGPSSSGEERESRTS